MNAKIITLHIADETRRDQYIARLREISGELQSLADEFGESSRTVLADLTYIVVGDDIMTTIHAMDDD